MFEAVSVNLLKTYIAEFRTSKNSAFTLSNYYNTSLEQKDWFLNAQSGGLFFFGSDALTGFNTYFFIADSVGLTASKLTLPRNKKFITEFIFNANDNELVFEHFKKLGFNVYAHLKKLSLLRKNEIAWHSNLITVCNMNDVSYLRDVFDNQFDHISERYPSYDELISAISAGSLFKYLDKGRMVGFYWADTKKFLSELRYIFVEDTYRGFGIGKALFKHHLFVTQSIKKNQLWVLCNNFSAITLYKKFGYRYDGTQDLIFLRVNMKDKIIYVLSLIRPEFDFTESENFIEEGLLDSFDLISLVSYLDKEFRVSIEGAAIVPENFKSLTTIETMLYKYVSQ